MLQGALDPLNDAKGRARQLAELCSGMDVELLQAGGWVVGGWVGGPWLVEGDWLVGGLGGWVMCGWL